MEKVKKKRMLTSSCKSKGRILQQMVRDKILEYFPILQPDDVKSTSMGAGGEDLLLSPRARELLPISLECKSHAKYAVYKDYKQCCVNAKNNEPVLVIKQNHCGPLVIVDLDYFLDIMKLSIDRSN